MKRAVSVEVDESSLVRSTLSLVVVVPDIGNAAQILSLLRSSNVFVPMGLHSSLDLSFPARNSCLSGSRLTPKFHMWPLLVNHSEAAV
jgi:hypothetical protein